MKFKAYKSGKKSRKFDILQMILSAHNNKNQNQQDKYKLGSNNGSYKQFESLQALNQTLPKTQIKTLNEFIAKHEIILPSVLPEHYSHSYLDLSSATFNGPFVRGAYLIIEQHQTDKLMQIGRAHV